MKLSFHGYTLTGGGQCPEQYDVTDAAGEKVGYIRLRGGWFTAEVPDACDQEVLRFCFPDMWKGEFEDDEREEYLNAAVISIDNYLKRKDVQHPMDPQAWMKDREA